MATVADLLRVNGKTNHMEMSVAERAKDIWTAMVGAAVRNKDEIVDFHGFSYYVINNQDPTYFSKLMFPKMRWYDEGRDTFDFLRNSANMFDQSRRRAGQFRILVRVEWYEPTVTRVEAKAPEPQPEPDMVWEPREAPEPAIQCDQCPWSTDDPGKMDVHKRNAHPTQRATSLLGKTATEIADMAPDHEFPGATLPSELRNLYDLMRLDMPNASDYDGMVEEITGQVKTAMAILEEVRVAINEMPPMAAYSYVKALVSEKDPSDQHAG